MKITTQLKYAVGVLTAFALSSTIALELATQAAAQDAIVVNNTGLVRGGSQRWVKLELQDQRSTQVEKKIDTIIEALLTGDKELGIPRTRDAAYLEQMREVEKQWKSLKNLVRDYRAGNATESAVIRKSESFFELANAATLTSQKIAEKDISNEKLYILLVLLMNLVILGFVGYTVQKASKYLQGSVDTVQGRSTDIAETMKLQEKIILDQTSSVKSTTQGMEDLGSKTMQTAAQALASAKSAQAALETALTGAETVEKTTTGMTSLKEQVEDIAKQIVQLSEQTAQIQSISNLVSDVADQTNMLALNAAVEAARAGEQGKGFAVVAGEIRKLADQSGRSADKINTLIGDIQTSINSTIMVTDEGTKNAAKSLELADATNQAFNEIRSAMETVSRTNEQMADAAKLQAVTVQQSVSAMNAINLGAQEASTSTAKVKKSSDELDNLSKELSMAV